MCNKVIKLRFGSIGLVVAAEKFWLLRLDWLQRGATNRVCVLAEEGDTIPHNHPL